MLKNADAETLMAAARTAQAEGERLWAAGDWRNAAEQGWQAVRYATESLVLEVTGAPPPAVPAVYDPDQSNGISVAISKLAQKRGGKWEQMDARFSEAAYYLHHETYHGRVHHDDLDELLREAWDYIRRAEELAGET